MPPFLDAPLPRCAVYCLGMVPYRQAWEYQRQLHERLVAEPALPDQLLLLEHPSVYTLGTGSSVTHLKFAPDDPAYDLVRTERGGEVTHHCPGQIVGYPILNLHRYRLDLHWYLRQLEAVVIEVLANYDIPGERVPGLTGVWVDGYKVAAIGIRVKRWVTMHGFALNVCPDLAGFQQIVPCGIEDRPVGSLAQFVPDIALAAVYQDLAIAFGQVMGCAVTAPIHQLPPIIRGTSQGSYTQGCHR